MPYPPVSVRDTAAALSRREITAMSLLEHSLAVVNETNPTLKSFISLSVERARRRAAESDRRLADGAGIGPLDGLPFAVKDVFETTDLNTTAGSRAFANRRAGQDAAAITALEAAGAVLVGKTNLHEFAYGATGENAWSGTVPHPHDPTRLAGGSSSGSAAAVAVGAVYAALGTDTGGSVRVPAALCGLVGYKPSFGAISLEGTIPFCWSLDHGGILTRTVEDLVPFATCLAGLPAAAPDHDRPRALRIGVVDGWVEDAEPDAAHAFEQALAAFRALGASLIRIALPDRGEARTVSLVLQLSEALAFHGPHLARAGHLYGADVRSGLVLAQYLPAAAYVQCKRFVTDYRRVLASRFESVDLILTPTCPIVAPLIGTREVRIGGASVPLGNALTLFTSLFNLTGSPALSLPAARNRDGLALGVQLIGPAKGDAKLIDAALALERHGLGQDPSATHPSATAPSAPRSERALA
jgi:aspartyl-tRNA(Asn)/glutamyl-tRNA(Gln) amidotransferase subunit A